MIAVYLAHPLSAPTVYGIEQNRKRAAEWAKWLHGHGFAVECSWITLTGVIEETPENRARGLRADCELVSRCDVMVLCGPRVSSGMLQEAAYAKMLIDFTHLALDYPVLASGAALDWQEGQPTTLEAILERSRNV